MEKHASDRENVYLDNAATTRPLPEVILTMGQVSYDTFANPSSTHSAGRDAKVVVENARREVARCLGVRSSRLFFTSGGTESDNTVLRGAREGGIRRIVSCRAEHHAITETLRVLERENRFFLPEHRIAVEYVGLDQEGRLRMEELERILSREPRTPTLVSLMHANNETGNLHDIRAIGRLCHDHGALYHTDAVQTVGRVPMDLSDLPVDFLSASAHKFHGPKGVGLLYVREEGSLMPLVCGGGQERGMRSGTENVAGIAGLACALRIACERMEEDAAHIRRLRERLLQGLSGLPGLRFNGPYRSGAPCLSGIVNLTLAVRKDPSIVLLLLDMAGVEVSAGSACMAGAVEPSAVLAEMYGGDRDPMAGYPSVRISMGRFNTPQDIDIFVSALKKVLDGYDGPPVSPGK